MPRSPAAAVHSVRQTSRSDSENGETGEARLEEHAVGDVVGQRVCHVANDGGSAGADRGRSTAISRDAAEDGGDAGPLRGCGGPLQLRHRQIHREVKTIKGGLRKTKETVEALPERAVDKQLGDLRVAEINAIDAYGRPNLCATRITSLQAPDYNERKSRQRERHPRFLVHADVHQRGVDLRAVDQVQRAPRRSSTGTT